MLDENIFVFDYQFDMKQIQDAYTQYSDEFVPYEDHRCRMEDWLIARNISFDYADELCQLFQIKAKPRFYVLKANAVLYPHRDSGTECSINILMSDEPAPVSYSLDGVAPQTMDGLVGKEYLYRTALLNTQNLHWVKNGPVDRVMLKLSIFDETYASVCEKVRRVVQA